MSHYRSGVACAHARSKPPIPSSRTSHWAHRSEYFRAQRSPDPRNRRWRGAGTRHLDIPGSDQPRLDQRHAVVSAPGWHWRGHARGRARRGCRVEESELSGGFDRARSGRLAGLRGGLGHDAALSGRGRRRRLPQRLPRRTRDDRAHGMDRDARDRQTTARRNSRRIRRGRRRRFGGGPARQGGWCAGSRDRRWAGKVRFAH